MIGKLVRYSEKWIKQLHQSNYNQVKIHIIVGETRDKKCWAIVPIGSGSKHTMHKSFLVVIASIKPHHLKLIASQYNKKKEEIQFEFID